MNKQLVLVFFALLININIAMTQEYKNEFGIKIDNDSFLFTKQDRYYTNGLFLNFRRAINAEKLNDKTEKVIYQISAGQKIYNPYAGSAPNPNLHDRPFAGHLFAALGLTKFSTNETLIKASLSAGVIGPASLAKESQEVIHRNFNFYELNGWEYQIANMLAINAELQFAKLIHRNSANHFDLTFDAAANLGTSNIDGNIGLVFRIGSINQLFNSSYYHANISHQNKTKKLKLSEFYFYAKPQLNLIAYDATIEGSLFNDKSPVTFEPKHLVFKQTFGLNYTRNRFSVDYQLNFLTKEVESDIRHHQYGSISLYYAI